MIGLAIDQKEPRMSVLRRPLTLVLGLCLLGALALGGSAFAVASHTAKHAATKPPVYQQRCANGAVKAIVLVVADQNKGFQKDYSADKTFFQTHWSCNPNAVFQARRWDRGIYDVRILGNGGQTPLVTPIGGPVTVGLQKLDDGGWRITTLADGAQVDENFVLVFL
jgi:hypothetical protein